MVYQLHEETFEVIQDRIMKLEVLDINRFHDRKDKNSLSKIVEIIMDTFGEVTLQDILSSFHSEGYVILKGIGVNYLNLEEVNFKIIQEALLLGVTKVLGFNPYGYAQEKSGAIIHDIKPVPNKYMSVSSEGNIEFGLHADGAYLDREKRPHTLTLLCINNEAQTSTKLVHIQKIIDKLDSEEIEVLLGKSFIHVAPETFKVKNKNNLNAILERQGSNQDIEVKVATHSCKPIGKRPQEVFNKFVCIANDLSFEYNWSKGDLIILNNLKMLHGRGEIVGKRHLTRCYGNQFIGAFEVLDLDN